MPKDLEISYLIDFYGDVLTPKQKDVMEQYYNNDFSLAEIAENFGITRQGVRDSIKRGESILLDLEDKVGFAARYRIVREKLQQLEDLTGCIDSRNQETYPPSAEIGDCVQRMLQIFTELAGED